MNKTLGKMLISYLALKRSLPASPLASVHTCFTYDQKLLSKREPDNTFDRKP